MILPAFTRIKLQLGALYRLPTGQLQLAGSKTVDLAVDLPLPVETGPLLLVETDPLLPVGADPLLQLVLHKEIM